MSKRKIESKHMKNSRANVHDMCGPKQDMSSILAVNCTVVHVLRTLKPLMNFVIRLYLAFIFFRVGLMRISDWEATVFLFEYEYKLPLLSPSVAATIVTILDLVVAPMLVLGFATRYAAILLLIMVSFMHFFYQAEPENYYCMLLLGTLAVYGGSRWSIDNLLKRRYCK